MIDVNWFIVFSLFKETFTNTAKGANQSLRSLKGDLFVQYALKAVK